MKYAWMEKNKLLWPVWVQCRALSVSASGYRQHRARQKEILPRLLARNFTVAAANTVWGGDMTYIPTDEGWLYLAAVLDLFSRRIVGWSMGPTVTADLACRALDMAWYSRSPVAGLIFHSDRGSQYASRCYTDLLAGHGVNASMSRKGRHMFCCGVEVGERAGTQQPVKVLDQARGNGLW